ncbi:MAG TPA: sulfotransferase, partial [Gammaproteobacteria bacterium]
MPPEAWHQRLQSASAAHQRGEWEAAERDYRAVLAAAPEQPDAVHFLGLLLHQQGRSGEALGLLTRALPLSPRNHLFRGNLASVLQQLGRDREAEPLFLEALALKPDYVGGYLNLGMLYAGRGDYLRALAQFDQALRFEPGSFAAWFSRAETLQQLARRAGSVEAYRRAAQAASQDPDLQLVLGAALREAGEVDEALRCHRRAVALAPQYAPAESALGNLIGMQGDLRAAESHYRHALQLKPDYAGAYYNLADVKKLGPDDAAWPGLMQLAERADSLPPEEALALHFTLGKVWDGQGEYPKAFAHLEAGNRLKRSALNYDEARQARFFADFARVFDAAFIAGRALDTADPRPVFIVGMPRSGTTLVEQILGSHPQVHGAGETHALRNCLREELPPDPGDYALPEALARLEKAGFQRAAARYSAYLDSLVPAAARITNKLPGNMLFVGLVSLLYPQARIIHCSRDAMDTCFSCYSKLFTTGHPFAYEQGELGRFYRMYDGLMRHWSQVLPGRMLELRYEELVADFEPQVRRLIDHLELPWDEACLNFHESPRAVRTASLAQVRRPIYK